ALIDGRVDSPPNGAPAKLAGEPSGATEIISCSGSRNRGNGIVVGVVVASFVGRGPGCIPGLHCDNPGVPDPITPANATTVNNRDRYIPSPRNALPVRTEP